MPTYTLLNTTFREGTVTEAAQQVNISADRATIVGVLPDADDVADPTLSVTVTIQRARQATPDVWDDIIGTAWAGGGFNRDGTPLLPNGSTRSAGLIVPGDWVRGSLAVSRRVRIGLSAVTE